MGYCSRPLARVMLSVFLTCYIKERKSHYFALFLLTWCVILFIIISTYVASSNWLWFFIGDRMLSALFCYLQSLKILFRWKSPICTFVLKVQAQILLLWSFLPLKLLFFFICLDVAKQAYMCLRPGSATWVPCMTQCISVGLLNLPNWKNSLTTFTSIAYGQFNRWKKCVIWPSTFQDLARSKKVIQDKQEFYREGNEKS